MLIVWRELIIIRTCKDLKKKKTPKGSIAFHNMVPKILCSENNTFLTFYIHTRLQVYKVVISNFQKL